MSYKALEKVVKKAKRDSFVEGTVVRWTASGRYNYAAIKTSAGWFTTAREFNPYVPQTVTFEKLLEILGRSEVSDVAVAGTWESIG
jgi:hypothetical protein